MLENILLGIVFLLTLLIYIRVIIVYIINRKKESNLTASELGLRVLDNEYSINLIESKESIFSKYNIKRKMVKLSSFTYDSSNYFSLAISSLLSGYSIIENKFLGIISYVFKEIKFITFSPIVAIVVSFLVNNSFDAKLGLFILLLIAVYQYMLNAINTDAILKVKGNDDKVNKILELIGITTKVSFIVTLIQIIRLVIIMLDI